MGDKEISKPHLLLQILQHINDLCLDRDIQGRDGLIADNKFGTYGQSPRYAHTLPLSAGKFMGIAAGVISIETDPGKQIQNVLLSRLS